MEKHGDKKDGKVYIDAKEVIAAKKISGKTYPQIADELGVTRSSLQVRISKKQSGWTRIVSKKPKSKKLATLNSMINQPSGDPLHRLPPGTKRVIIIEME